MAQVDLKKLEDAVRTVYEEGGISGNCLMIGDASGLLATFQNGTADIAGTREMNERSILRMYSLTKIVTLIAVMQLWEQGWVHLSDPVSGYLPSFGALTVMTEDGPVPTDAVMTIEHLLTMTSGIPYTDTTGAFRLLARGWRREQHPGDGTYTIPFAERIATHPLEFAPGEGFRYGLSYDVLGAIVEVITGTTLADYSKEFIFAPLGMEDCGFSVREDQKDRVADICVRTSNGLGKAVGIGNPVVDLMRFDAPDFYSGGAGLVGSVRDLYILTNMLFLDGTYEGKQILAKETVDLLRTQKLNEKQRAMYRQEFSDDMFRGAYPCSYGFGVRICMEQKAPLSVPVGEWGWSGALGTWQSISQEAGLFFVYGEQRIAALYEGAAPALYKAIYAHV